VVPLRHDGGRLDATPRGTAVSWDAFAAFRIVNKLNGFEHISHGTTLNPFFI
jgi:hypothetical protein